MDLTPPDTSSSPSSNDGTTQTAPRRQLIDPVDVVDPIERKRMLSVLAQRRYRRRKKEQQAQLEGLVRSIGGGGAAQASLRAGKSQTLQTPGDGPTLARAADLPAGDDLDLGPCTGEANDWAFLGASPDPLPPTQEYDIEPQQSPWRDLNNPTFDEWLVSLDYAPDEGPGCSTQLGEFLQDERTKAQSFPDDRLLVVPELGLLRAALTIAVRLNSADRLWDAAAQSVFQTHPGQGWMELLPRNLRPTAAQRSTPHHPVLDILPWPSMRGRLIGMYALPPDLWPRRRADGSELNVFRLVCDMEAGGIRVWGDDPAAEDSWEVSQDFAEAWWWALDEDIVRLSNRRRAARGEPRLTMGLLTDGSASD